MTLSRRSTIKALGVVGAGSTLSGTVLGVSEHEDDERDPAEAPTDGEVGALRVAHFSPDAPAVDVYVDDDRILAGLAYDEISPYLEIVPGSYTVTVTAADDPDTVVYNELLTVDSTFYTAAAIGELQAEEVPADTEQADEVDDTDETGDERPDAEDDQPDAEDEADTPGTFDVLVLVDREPDEVEEETASLRFVHAVPDAPTVDVADEETGLPVFEDVSFGEPSGYVPVVPDEQTVAIFPADDDGDDGFDEDGDDVITPPDPVASADLDLDEGFAYTAYAIGYLEADQPDVEGAEADELEDDRSLAVTLAVDGTTAEDVDGEAETDGVADDAMDEGFDDEDAGFDGDDERRDEDDYWGEDDHRGGDERRDDWGGQAGDGH